MFMNCSAMLMLIWCCVLYGTEGMESKYPVDDVAMYDWYQREQMKMVQQLKLSDAEKYQLCSFNQWGTDYEATKMRLRRATEEVFKREGFGLLLRAEQYNNAQDSNNRRGQLPVPKHLFTEQLSKHVKQSLPSLLDPAGDLNSEKDPIMEPQMQKSKAVKKELAPLPDVPDFTDGEDSPEEPQKSKLPPAKLTGLAAAMAGYNVDEVDSDEDDSGETSGETGMTLLSSLSKDRRDKVCGKDLGSSFQQPALISSSKGKFFNEHKKQSFQRQAAAVASALDNLSKLLAILYTSLEDFVHEVLPEEDQKLLFDWGKSRSDDRGRQWPLLMKRVNINVKESLSATCLYSNKVLEDLKNECHPSTEEKCLESEHLLRHQLLILTRGSDEECALRLSDGSELTSFGQETKTGFINKLHVGFGNIVGTKFTSAMSGTKKTFVAGIFKDFGKNIDGNYIKDMESCAANVGGVSNQWKEAAHTVMDEWKGWFDTVIRAWILCSVTSHINNTPQERREHTDREQIAFAHMKYLFQTEEVFGENIPIKTKEDFYPPFDPEVGNICVKNVLFVDEKNKDKGKALFSNFQGMIEGEYSQVVLATIKTNLQEPLNTLKQIVADSLKTCHRKVTGHYFTEDANDLDILQEDSDDDEDILTCDLVGEAMFGTCNAPVLQKSKRG